MKRIIVVAISVILALAVATPAAIGQSSSKSKDLGGLTGPWWNWAVEDQANSPLFGDYSSPEKCDGSNSTGEWFLAGEFESEENAGGGWDSEATRTCTLPAKTKIFFPVFNIVCSPAYKDDPNDERWKNADGSSGGFPGCAKYYTDLALANNDPVAKVDGKNVPIKRAASGDFSLVLPYDAPDGSYVKGTYPAATDGLWVSLPALSKGKHKVEFGGDFANPFGSGSVHTKTTYNLTVK